MSNERKYVVSITHGTHEGISYRKFTCFDIRTCSISEIFNTTNNVNRLYGIYNKSIKECDILAKFANVIDTPIVTIVFIDFVDHTQRPITADTFKFLNPESTVIVLSSELDRGVFREALRTETFINFSKYTNDAVLLVASCPKTYQIKVINDARKIITNMLNSRREFKKKLADDKVNNDKKTDEKTLIHMSGTLRTSLNSKKLMFVNEDAIDSGSIDYLNYEGLTQRIRKEFFNSTPYVYYIERENCQLVLYFLRYQTSLDDAMDKHSTQIECYSGKLVIVNNTDRDVDIYIGENNITKILNDNANRYCHFRLLYSKEMVNNEVQPKQLCY